MNVYKDTDEPYVDPGNTPEESGVSDVPATSTKDNSTANTNN